MTAEEKLQELKDRTAWLEQQMDVHLSPECIDLIANLVVERMNE